MQQVKKACPELRCKSWTHSSSRRQPRLSDSCVMGPGLGHAQKKQKERAPHSSSLLDHCWWGLLTCSDTEESSWLQTEWAIFQQGTEIAHLSSMASHCLVSVRESQLLWSGWGGEAPQEIAQSNPRAQSQVMHSRLPRTASCQGCLITSLGNLLQCLATSTSKSFLKWEFLYFNLWPCSFVLGVGTTEKTDSRYYPHQVFIHTKLSRLSSRLSCLSSLSFLPMSFQDVSFLQSFQDVWSFTGPTPAHPHLSCTGQAEAGPCTPDVPHQCWIKGKDLLPWLTGNALPNAVS